MMRWVHGFADPQREYLILSSFSFFLLQITLRDFGTFVSFANIPENISRKIIEDKKIFSIIFFNYFRYRLIK